MGILRGPNIVKDGIKAHYDFGSYRCYPAAGSIVYNLADKDFISGSLVGPSLIYDTTTESFPYFNFSGSNGDISGSNGLEFISGSPFTVDVWIKPDTLNNDCTFFGVGNVNSNGQLLHLRTVSGNTSVVFGMWFDDLTVTVSNNANKWVNYTFVMDSSISQSIYENGSFVGSRGSSDYYRGNGSWVIGDWGRTTSRELYTGSISSVIVYNRELSTDEIEQNYNALRRRYGL